MTSMILADTRWRIEVYKKGKYWGWRRGSGKERQYRYGGKFKRSRAGGRQPISKGQALEILQQSLLVCERAGS